MRRLRYSRRRVARDSGLRYSRDSEPDTPGSARLAEARPQCQAGPPPPPPAPSGSQRRGKVAGAAATLPAPGCPPTFWRAPPPSRRPLARSGTRAGAARPGPLSRGPHRLRPHRQRVHFRRLRSQPRPSLRLGLPRGQRTARAHPSGCCGAALFQPGDCFDPFLAEESERLLRGYNFLSEVDIFPVPLPDSTVQVIVDTRRMEHARGCGSAPGGASRCRAAPDRDNLLGTG
jgi:hypothetical protein